MVTMEWFLLEVSASMRNHSIEGIMFALHIVLRSEPKLK